MQDPQTDSIPLTALAVGKRGILAPPRAGSVPLRLLELGFVEGTEITVVRSGALGDPLEFELRGYRICLRRRDLDGIRVVAAHG